MLLLVLAIGAVGILMVARTAMATADAATARTAADAAALAGATAGPGAAEAIASANGAEMIDYQVDGDAVEVVVRVDDARARARAEISVDWVP